MTSNALKLNFRLKTVRCEAGFDINMRISYYSERRCCTSECYADIINDNDASYLSIFKNIKFFFLFECHKYKMRNIQQTVRGRNIKVNKLYFNYQQIANKNSLGSYVLFSCMNLSNVYFPLMT